MEFLKGLNLTDAINDFKTALIWQDDKLESLDLTINDFDNDSDKLVTKILTDFINQLNEEQIKAIDYDGFNVGHPLALELMGHGAGFFDSESEIISAITDCDYIKNNSIEDVCLDSGKMIIVSKNLKPRLEPANIEGAKHLGVLEFECGEYFDILQTSDKLVFGNPTNACFLQSGYFIVEEYLSIDENLQNLNDDLECFLNGESYTDQLIVNDRGDE